VTVAWVEIYGLIASKVFDDIAGTFYSAELLCGESEEYDILLLLLFFFYNLNQQSEFTFYKLML
jgi:hypothetical protein